MKHFYSLLRAFFRIAAVAAALVAFGRWRSLRPVGVAAIALSLLLPVSPAAGQGQSGTLAFKYRDHLLVSGAVEGKRGSFIFDTATKGLCLDAAFFEEAGLAGRRDGKSRANALSVAAAGEAFLSDTLSFAAGPLSYRFPSASVFPLRGLVGEEVDGIVGMKPLEGKVFGIDFDASQLRLYASLPHLDYSRFRGVELALRGGQPCVSAVVSTQNGIEISGTFLVDLGFSGTVFLDSATASRYALDRRLAGTSRTVIRPGGIGREQEAVEFRSEAVRIGEYLLAGLKVRYAASAVPFLPGDDCCGVLGSAFFKYFESVFDLPGQRLYLRPLVAAFDEDPENTLGFSFINYAKTSRCWIVSNLLRGGPAERAGMMLDDRVVKVNGKRVARYDYDERAALLRSKKPVRLTVLRDGSRKELLLQPDAGGSF